MKKSRKTGKKSPKIRHRRMRPGRRKGKIMESPSSTEISLIDVMDGIQKARGSIGYLADNSSDSQLTSVLMLIEESLSMTQQSLQYMFDRGIEDEFADQLPPFTVSSNTDSV